jgi:RNA polymerase sigma-70 factor (ECF subfamily)
MDRAVATLEAAVAGGHLPLARRSLGEVSDEAEREAVLDVLARQAVGGSQMAVELLVEAIDRWGVARHAVERVLLDEAAVDEVTEETLIAVALSVESGGGGAGGGGAAGSAGVGRGPGGGAAFAGGRFTPWLDKLARDRAIERRRRRRGGADAAKVRALLESRPAVGQMLEALPERYRDAVLLHDVEGLPYAEVAVRLGRSGDAVRSHVARGRALLAGSIVRTHSEWWESGK